MYSNHNIDFLSNPKPPEVIPRVYTVDEAAKILRLHRNTIYRRIKMGVWEHIRIGTDIRIVKSSFDSWIENQINQNQRSV